MVQVMKIANKLPERRAVVIPLGLQSMMAILSAAIRLHV